MDTKENRKIVQNFISVMQSEKKQNEETEVDISETVTDLETEVETTYESKSVGMRRALEQVWMEAASQESSRKHHYKGATKPEEMLDKESPKSKEFVAKHTDNIDQSKHLKNAHADSKKAASYGTQAPGRRGDQKVGDLKMPTLKTDK